MTYCETLFCRDAILRVHSGNATTYLSPLYSADAKNRVPTVIINNFHKLLMLNSYSKTQQITEQSE